MSRRSHLNIRTGHGRIAGVNDQESQIVTAETLATLLKVSDKTIFRWAQRGRIPCLRIERSVRFEKAAVLEALRSGQRRPTP